MSGTRRIRDPQDKAIPIPEIPSQVKGSEANKH